MQKGAQSCVHIYHSENGQRYAFEASVVNHRCPQKMISFYESRLRFRTDAAELPPLTTATSRSQTTSQQQQQDEAEVSSAQAAQEGQQEASDEAANKEGAPVEAATQAEEGNTEQDASLTTSTTVEQMV